jgi:sulfatase modifying factor 1
MSRLSMVRVLAMFIAVSAFSSSGCGKVLGLHEGVPGGACALSSDCPPDEVCVGAVCSPVGEASLGDADASGAHDAGSEKDASSGNGDGTPEEDAGSTLADGSDATDANSSDEASGSDADADGGTVAPSMHCNVDNTFACAGHAHRTVLSCNPTTHVWTIFAVCGGQQLCDTTPGPNQGSCQDPAAGCAGKVPGAKVCSGKQSVTCGVDLVTSTSEACPHVCIDSGQCADCTPLSTQCSGHGVQTCQADGTWGPAVACVDQACAGGACTGVCRPNTAPTHCSNNTPQYCDASGAWHNSGVACTKQACVDGTCIGVCAPGASHCSGSQPQICDANGAWQNNGADCAGSTPLCSAGTCQNAGPSCAGLANTCGPTGDANCCAANVVTGGTYNRSNEPTDPATVSDFRLDNYEITVGRFRKFVAAYSPTMTAAGAGKNPNNASDPGWDIAWNATMPASASDLTAGVKCNPGYHTWTDSPGTNESLPINCIDWPEAYAFCIWDGGRLPTEAEWNYAATAGSEQRRYPWGAAAPDCSFANFANGDFCVLPGTGSTNRVGSESIIGDGKWGQSDLVGNVWEWVQDVYVSSYPHPCNNCSNTAPGPNRVARGGCYGDNASFLLTSFRYSAPASNRDDVAGARCARPR